MSKKTIPQDPSVSSRSLGGLGCFGGLGARRCAEPEPCDSAQPPGDPEGTAAAATGELELDPGRFISDRSAVRELAELLRRSGRAAVIVLDIDNDSFSVRTPAWYDVPEEDPTASEGAPAHWATVEAARARSELRCPGVSMPHELLSALAHILGIRVTWC